MSIQIKIRKSFGLISYLVVINNTIMNEYMSLEMAQTKMLMYVAKYKTIGDK